MRVLFTTLRNTSHFLPLVPFIAACRQRGHDVAVAAPKDLAERVANENAEFFPFGHPGDEGLRPIWARLRDASDEEKQRTVVRDIFAGVCASAALPGVLSTIERWRPDIIVRESQEYAGLVAAEKLGMPHVRIGITASRAELETLAFAAPSVDAHRRSVGLEPDPAGERVRREAVLTFFPRSLGETTPEMLSARRFRAHRKQAAPLPDWWQGQSGPFVYVTLGTAAGMLEAMRASFRTVLDAVCDLPIRVLMTIGPDLPTDVLGDTTLNVHVERFVPQDDVIPHAAAVLCHGGSGTVLGTLATGVPMLVTPMFADQPHNAERIAELGAGLNVPMSAATPDTVRDALTRVCEEPSFRSAAQAIAAEIAALPSIDDAPAEIERLAQRRET